MKKHGFKLKVAAVAAVCLLATAAVAAMIYTIQYRSTFEDIRKDLSRELDTLQDHYFRSLPMKESTEVYNNKIYQSFAELIVSILTREGAEPLSDEMLSGICTDLGAENIIIIDKQGNVLYKARPVSVDFTRDRFNQLKAACDLGTATDGFTVNSYGSDHLYYGYPMGDNRIAVLTVPAAELEQANEEAFGWSNILANASLGIDGFSMVVDPMKFSIIWAEDETLIGKSITDVVESGDLSGEDLFVLNIDGKKYHAAARFVSGTLFSLVTCISEEEVKKTITMPVVFLTLIFLLASGLLGAFCLILNREEKIADFKTIVKKIFPVGLALLVFMVLFTFYLQTLCSLSVGMMRNDANASGIRTTVTKYDTAHQKITERNDYCTQRTAQLAAYMVSRFPDMKNTEGLATLAKIAGCEEIRLFDTEGKTIATSRGKDGFVLSEDPETPSFEFRRLLTGVNTYCQPAGYNDNGEYRQYAGVALRDQNGDNIGLIQVCVVPVQVINANENYSYEAALSTFVAGKGTFAFATDKDKYITWCPEINLIGKNALEYGLTETNFRDGFNGFLNTNGKECFGSCKENEDHYIFVATPQADIYKNRARNVIANVIVLELMLILVTAALPAIAAKKRDAAAEEEAEKIHPVLTAEQEKQKRSLHYYVTEQWQTSTSAKKMLDILKGCFIAFAVAISILYVFRNSLLNEGSIVKYVFDGNWERGLNAFSLTACITLVSVVTVAVGLVKRLFDFLSKSMDSRGETVCRLIGSFVYIFSIFGCLYFALAFLGVDTSTLLASAGIMSVVIGLGANQMISNILAGVSIVFNGSTKVGDWINTGDAEGVVSEIGISSTKIIDRENRVHIIPNSKMDSIVNSTVPKYRVRIYLKVAFDESLDRIREMIEKEAAGIRERHPQILNGPMVDGITDLSSGDYEVCFSINCDGKYQRKMQRAMRDELRNLFIKYEIKRG